jgi:hypothetical protein
VALSDIDIAVQHAMPRGTALPLGADLTVESFPLTSSTLFSPFERKFALKNIVSVKHAISD